MQKFTLAIRHNIHKVRAFTHGDMYKANLSLGVMIKAKTACSVVLNAYLFTLCVKFGVTVSLSAKVYT